MCDHILMTEGSGLFLAGPALVQAAIGQKTSRRRTGRREDARADQRHRRFSRARRRGLPRPHSLAGGHDGPSAGAPFDHNARRAAGVSRRGNLRHLFLRSGAAIRHARDYRAHRGRQPLRRIPRRIRPDAALRLRAHRRLGRGHRRQPEEECAHRGSRRRASGASNSAA